MLTGAGELLVRTASTGQVLVDGGAARSPMRCLRSWPRGLRWMAAFSNSFNTHWHLDRWAETSPSGSREATLICSRKDPGASGPTDYYHGGSRTGYEKAAARMLLVTDRNLVFR